jgi:hypothetical protein
VTCPGRFFTYSISSPSVLMPREGRTAIAIGCSQTKLIDTNSRTRSTIVFRDFGQRDEARRQSEEERVAIGRRRAGHLHANRAGRTRMIGDEYLLAPSAR